MAVTRKPRIEFEGAFYHVITRGNQRQPVFKDKDDYSRYLKILADYKIRYDYSLYAYVLMSNTCISSSRPKRSLFSRSFRGSTRATPYISTGNIRPGHLFQGRYKAILCDKDAYLLSLVKYIHLNPVRAKIVKTLEEYPWTSHRHYVERAEDQRITDKDQVLRMFSEDKGRARRLYPVVA